MKSSPLIVFAKLPIEGRVKTRLAKSTSFKFATTVYKEFLNLFFQRLNENKIEFKIAIADGSNLKLWKLWLPNHEFIVQKGDDLGSRLFYVAKNEIKNHSSIIITGSDSPDLPIEYINITKKKLLTNDVVIGPSHDGGYYLLALTKKGVQKELFQNINWSTNTVFDETINKLNKLKLKYEIIDKWYDVDNIDDLRELKIRISRSQETLLNNTDLLKIDI